MIGQTISHYRITGQLGSGGMGVVYEAQDLTLGRRVASSSFPQFSSDPAALERFLLEARAASALNHPNICTIYAVENDAGQSFISMELLEGESLSQKLAQRSAAAGSPARHRPSNSPTPWTPPTPKASSIATSNRRTFSSLIAAR